MKVLWFSPIPTPAICRELGVKPAIGGWWIDSMLPLLAGSLELTVAWASRSCSTRRSFTSNGVRYCIFPNPGRFARGNGLFRKVGDRLEQLIGNFSNQPALNEAVAVVQQCQPDLVNVFGSEHGLGLIAPSI